MKAAALLLSVAAMLPAAETFPAGHWASKRGKQWSAAGLREAREYAQGLKTAAVMIVQDGGIVDQWGDTAAKYPCHSMRKSLLSALYGALAAEGKIHLDATLESLGIDDNAPRLTAIEKHATVRDLLEARSGIYHPALYETASMKMIKPPRGSMAPGSHWVYNNWDFNALGTIFEKAAGRRIYEEFGRRIAGPIGMEDFTVADGERVTGDASEHAAYPVKMSARDLARFGLLFLREGNWRGSQVLPAEWVRESTRSYSDARGYGGSGYGYMWWVDGGWYSARGAGGHMVAVVPALDLVVVHRVNTAEAGNSVRESAVRTLMHKIVAAAGRPDVIPAYEPRLAPPCLTPKADCTERLYIGERYVSIYRNYPVQTGAHPGIQRALVMVHGAGRNANDYYGTAMAAAVAAGKLERTILVAPHFKANDGKGCKDPGEPEEALFPCGGWREGEAALNRDAGRAVHSYDFVDRALELFNDKDRFPDLREVVVAGHSAGGQFVQRYAGINRAESAMRVPVRYVVANPSTYMYLSDIRPRSTTTCSPQGGCTVPFAPYWDSENCTTYNQFKYGLEKLTGYAAGVGAEAIRGQYAKRAITYMVGELDRQRDPSLDKTCPAMAQGPNRYERGVNFWNYAKEQLQAAHPLAVAPGCGHSATCMYAGATGLKVLFPE
ncbi:MAG: serine hydrolase [Bryobacteraceae bacterium]